MDEAIDVLFELSVALGELPNRNAGHSPSILFQQMGNETALTIDAMETAANRDDAALLLNSNVDGITDRVDKEEDVVSRGKFLEHGIACLGFEALDARREIGWQKDTKVACGVEDALGLLSLKVK